VLLLASLYFQDFTLFMFIFYFLGLSGNREGKIFVWELQSCPPVLSTKYVVYQLIISRTKLRDSSFGGLCSYQSEFKCVITTICNMQINIYIKKIIQLSEMNNSNSYCKISMVFYCMKFLCLVTLFRLSHPQSKAPIRQTATSFDGR